MLQLTSGNEENIRGVYTGIKIDRETNIYVQVGI